MLLFSLFATSATIYAALVWRELPGTSATGLITALLGFAGITASAWIYLVPALLLGALSQTGRTWETVAMWTAAIQATNFLIKMLRLRAAAEFELHASAVLLQRELSTLVYLRLALLMAGGIVLPALHHGWLGLATAFTGEIVSRYLFFVSVVPRNIASVFLGGGSSQAGHSR